MEGSQRRVKKKPESIRNKQVKFKPCTATTGLLQQTLLSKKSPILANQSLVPLGLWYSSLTESSQGFTLATENTDWQLDHGWQAGYIRWKPQCKLPATHHGRDWEQGETLVPVFKVRSDRPRKHAQNPQMYFKTPIHIIWESKSGFQSLPKAAQYSLYLNPPTLSEDTPMYLSLFFFAFFLSSRSRSSS